MCLASEDNAALLSDYPYPFKLVARYTLEDAAVRVSYEVTQRGHRGHAVLYRWTPRL